MLKSKQQLKQEIMSTTNIEDPIMADAITNQQSFNYCYGDRCNGTATRKFFHSAFANEFKADMHLFRTTAMHCSS